MSFDAIFCRHCGKLLNPNGLVEECSEPTCQTALESARAMTDAAEAQPHVGITLNRKQRRQAIARAKIRVRKEKGRGR